jgi:hypothetical protein
LYATVLTKATVQINEYPIKFFQVVQRQIAWVKALRVYALCLQSGQYGGTTLE